MTLMKLMMMMMMMMMMTMMMMMMMMTISISHGRLAWPCGAVCAYADVHSVRAAA
jgi:hypothetical protein